MDSTCQSTSLQKGSSLSICKVYISLRFNHVILAGTFVFLAWLLIPLFICQTGEAEANLERLHQCAEKELQNYIGDGASEEFSGFRTKLAGLTRYILFKIYVSCYVETKTKCERDCCMHSSDEQSGFEGRLFNRVNRRTNELFQSGYPH